MAQEFAEHGIGFAFIYTREAHPGEKFPHHTSMEQKLAHAQAMVDRWQIKRAMLVDDLAGSLHQAYGRLPNMSYIVNAGGSILYRASWTDARSIRGALEQILFEREQRRAGTRTTPYYVEWQPQRVNDRQTFMEGLLNDVGPKAVEDFIAAQAHNGGDAAAGPLRAWWAEKQRVQAPAD